MAQRIQCLPAMRTASVRSLDQEDPPKKEMATHSGTLAWNIPQMEKPGRLQSTGPKSVGQVEENTTYLRCCLFSKSF